MEIHEIVDDAALQVVFDLVDDHLATDIDQLDIGEMLLILIDCLVNLLIFPDPVEEIATRVFRILPLVIRRRGFHLHDVCHYDIFIVTFGLDEQRLDAVRFAALCNPTTTGLGRIRSIQYGYHTLSTIEPLYHVVHSGLSSSVAHSLAFRVAFAEEFGRGLWSVIATIGADVETFCRNRKPGEVADH